MPRTQTDTEGTDRAQDTPVAWTFLYLILEADRPLLGGARYSLARVNEATFGRGADRLIERRVRDAKSCLRISVQNPRASETHARLLQVDGEWIIEDRGSKNGTFLNGHRVVDPTVVQLGDIIKIGRAFFMIEQALLPANAELPTDVDGSEAARYSLDGFETLVPGLAEHLRKVKPAIQSNDPITIVGETGTGKDVLAQAIHAASRPRGPFVPVNCASLTAGLVEGQLFGYVKGAYSGAERGDQGFVRSAEGGTLFLDEILDLPLTAQAKLLRVLQQKEIVPLGTARALLVDVRFLAATQRSFSDVVAKGEFRADLKARLDPHVIALPRLRERRQDIGLLVAGILRRFGAKESDGLVLTSKSVEKMLGHSWTENVRGLENALLRAHRFARDGLLDEAAFPEPDTQPGLAAAENRLSNGDRETRNQLIAALKKYEGNVAAVAKELSTNRQQVYRWGDRFGIDPASFRGPRDLDDQV